MLTMFSKSRREHVDKNADAGTSAEFDDFIMQEYLHINVSTMEQIVASSVAESVLRSVPWLRLLEQKRAGKCGAAGGDGPLARGTAGSRQGERHLPPTRLLRAPERAPDGMHTTLVMYLRSQWGSVAPKS